MTRSGLKGYKRHVAVLSEVLAGAEAAFPGGMVDPMATGWAPVRPCVHEESRRATYRRRSRIATEEAAGTNRNQKITPAATA